MYPEVSITTVNLIDCREVSRWRWSYLTLQSVC